MVVGPHPLGGEVLNLCNAGPIILGQSFVANRPFEPFNISVLLWLTWLDIFKPDTRLLGPALDHAAYVLRAIVTSDHLGVATPRNNLHQRPDHPSAWQREVHLDTERLAVEVVNDVEQADVASVLQAVMHKVHRPDLINALRHRQDLRLIAHQALSGFDAQVQL
jgi:hypothetical protein